MAQKHEQREEKMYESIKTHFANQFGCGFCFADLKADKKKVHLPHNLKKRDPDVIGIAADGEIHIGEGKCLGGAGNPFESCVQQLDSLIAYADFLYAFFPQEDWQRLSSEDKEQNRSTLNGKGYGLLLVNTKGDCRPDLAPIRNNRCQPAKKEDVRRGLGVSADDRLPQIDHLSSTDAANANEMLCCVYHEGWKIAKEVIAKVFKGKKVSPSFDADCRRDDTHNRTSEVFRSTAYPEDNIGIEFDPFGAYPNDGVPCLWVFKEVSATCVRDCCKLERSVFGTHIWFDDNAAMLPVGDMTEDRIKACAGMKREFWLGHRVEFFGRSRAGLKRELQELLLAAKALK